MLLRVNRYFPLALLFASAAKALISCSSTPISKGTLAIAFPDPNQKGPHLVQNDQGGFEARGSNESTIIWTFQCNSEYLKVNDTSQQEYPQARYGLMVLANGPDTIPSPDARCLAVHFDEGSHLKGSLVSQNCVLEDDESQTSQFFSLWKTQKPEAYWQFENFLGYPNSYNAGFNNPFPYGGGYYFTYKHGAVRVNYANFYRKTMLTLVPPRH